MAAVALEEDEEEAGVVAVEVEVIEVVSEVDVVEDAVRITSYDHFLFSLTSSFILCLQAEAFEVEALLNAAVTEDEGEVHPGDEEVVVEEGEAQKADPTLSLNHTGIRVFSSQRARIACL